MKTVLNTILLLSLLSIFTLTAFGASDSDVNLNSKQPEKIQYNQVYGTAEALTGEFKSPDGNSLIEKAQLFIASRQSDFKMTDPATELELISEKTDNLGFSHVRFQQVYEGLKVWGCQTIAHFKNDNIIYSVGGQTIATPNLSATPAINSRNAENEAVASLKSELVGITTEFSTELIIYPNEGNPRLAQMVVITSPNAGIRWRVFIDAQTGSVLFKFNDIHFDGPDVGSGPDTRDTIRSLNIYDTGGEFSLHDITHSAAITTWQNFYGGGPISIDPDSDKVWDDVATQKAEVAGHYYTMLSYEYLLNTFGRDSYDDNGADIMVNVHDPLYTNNAYWNGQGINFADGDGTNWLPWSGSLDVVAHELGHGVTEYTAGLIYAFMSGALNESYSDVMGANVDRDDWFVGEEISLTGGYVRSMSDPHLQNDPKHMSEYLYYNISTDNGGVHSNSGIPNYTYYLTATSIGRDDAEQIWYRCLTIYLTPSSNFYFWAGMLVQSAVDLYGTSSTEATAVETALAMVGLAGVYPSPEMVETGGLIGEMIEDTLWIHNPSSGGGTQTVTVIDPGIPGLTVTGGPGYQENIPDGDSSQFILTFDATTLDECNYGFTQDTLVFDVDGAFGMMEIRLPMSVAVGKTTRSKESDLLATSCLSTQIYNTNHLNYLSRDGNDVLYHASFMLGVADAVEFTTYRDCFGTQKFSPVTTIDSDAEKASFLFSSEDGRLQGTTTIMQDTSDIANCDFFLIDYAVYNPCDTALTVLAGFVADLDVDVAATNQVGRDDSRDMIWIRNDVDDQAAGMALLSGTTRNLRGIHNPTWIWGGNFTDQVAYNEMNSTNDFTVAFNDDWSALITFDKPIIAPGDTLHFVMALMYSTTGSAGMADIHDRAETFYASTGFVCADVNDDETVNILDITALIDYLYNNGPEPDPLERGDANGDGTVNILDITYIIAFLYNDGPEPIC